MSVISCKKEYTDLSAIEFFIKNSTTKLLSIESSHGILLLLELNTLLESPYSKLVWNGNEIEVKDVYSLVLKLTPLSYSKTNFFNNPKEKLYSSSFHDSRFLDTEKYQKYIQDEKVWLNELYMQKNIFYKTFMLDSSLYGVCPDVLSSFEINKSFYTQFVNILNFSEDIYKDRYTNENVYSVKEVLYNFFTELFTKSSSVYKVGCYFMEYLENSHDFSFFPCFDVNNKKDYGTLEEYQLYLIAKAKLLFQLDKLHFIGIKHNDLHIGNCMYIKNTNTSLLIDVATATSISNESHIVKRKRKFDSFDFIGNVYPEQSSYVSSMDLRKHMFSENCSDNIRCGYIHAMLDFEKESLRWNDLSKKEAKDVIHESSYKYIPLSRMNDVDKESVEKGKQIYSYLQQFSPNETIPFTLLQNYIYIHNLYFPCLSTLDIPKLCIESITEVLMKGGKRKIRKTKRKLNKCKGQKGGFYPSVYSGVTGAALLAPFAARQAYDFWNRRKTRKSKK
jgi:hypothetical protein